MTPPCAAWRVGPALTRARRDARAAVSPVCLHPCRPEVYVEVCIVGAAWTVAALTVDFFHYPIKHMKFHIF